LLYVGNKRQDRNTLRIATTHKLDQEIKSLRVKKSKLNEQILAYDNKS
jgi:hypothetical protein